MRLTELILILLISKVCFGQDKYIGFYYDRFHETIELKADSTFIHNYRFDLSSSWTTGKWKSKNDTIYLTTILVKDTVRLMNSSHKTINDSLVLSADQKIDRIEPNEYFLNQISSGGQNRQNPPRKLFWKKERLYRIKENGNLDLSKAKQFWTRKKYKTYFIKKNK
ncbi:hypothetical protein [Thalassobellus citreus]|uniref:hypothetical protein n=1 Tax=Thalassobellus citreus TaxID=3367752 RepID=UPI0037BCCDF6